MVSRAQICNASMYRFYFQCLVITLTGLALQTYSSMNDVQVLIETVRELYQHQGTFASNGSDDKKPMSRIKREDLQLICYEYIYA